MMILKQKKAFTLIELLVVMVLIGIMTTWATWSIRSTINFYHQLQAAKILSAAIRSVRSAALKGEVDERNERFYDTEYRVSTRNAFSIFIYRGRVDDSDISQTISDGSAGDLNEAGYSLVIVKNSGLDTQDKVEAPIFTDPTFTSLAGITNLGSRQDIVNFPSDVVIKYSSTDDEVSPGADPASSILGDMTYWSYDRLGNLNTRMGSMDLVDGFNNITESGLSDKETYLVIMVGASGGSAGNEADTEYSPIYIDLRNGNIIRIGDASDFANIIWPTFTNTP